MHWRASEVIDRLAAQNRAGLIFVDEYGHRRDYTFAEVAKYSLRYAAVLRAFGVREDERVYLKLSTTAKCIFTQLALARVGARVILDRAQAAGATTVIANRKYRSSVEDVRDHFSADARYLLIGAAHEGWARLDTVAHIASVALESVSGDEAKELLQARDAAQLQLGAFATDTVWTAMHIEDDDWFGRAIVQPWLCGAAVVAHNGEFDARERLDLVRELDVTILLQRVEEYRAELALPDPQRFKLPRLRRCVVLGNGFDELLQTQWADRYGVPLMPPHEAGTMAK